MEQFSHLEVPTLVDVQHIDKETGFSGYHGNG